jgi:hypothetical protein
MGLCKTVNMKIYCHVFFWSDRRRGIGLTTGFITSIQLHSVTVYTIHDQLAAESL